MKEGWFCPACQAFHAPHVDSCDLAHFRDDFECNICGMSAEKPVRCERADCKTHVLVNAFASREIH